MNTTRKKSRLVTLAKIAAVLVVLSVFIFLIFWLVLPNYVLAKVNSSLENALLAESHVESMDISLRQGHIRLHNLSIVQPEGYDKGIFLTVPQLNLEVDLFSVVNPPIRIRRIFIGNAEVNILKESDAGLNVMNLIQPQQKTTESDGTSIIIEEIQIENSSISYEDNSYSEGKLRFYLVNIDGEGRNISINPPKNVNSEAAAASATLTGRLRQVPGYDGYVGIALEAEAIQAGTIPMNSALRVVGLDLALLDTVLPPGTRNLIGGDAADIGFNLSMGENYLNGHVVVDTIGNYRHTLNLGGSPENVVLETSGLFEFLRERTGGIAGKVVGSAAETGAEIAGAAEESVKEVGSGAKKVAGSLLGGILKAAKGVATADPSEIAEGVKESTVETAKEVTETVAGTGRTLAKGATEAVTLSRKEEKNWWHNLEQRWQSRWQSATDFLETATLPPEPSANVLQSASPVNDVPSASPVESHEPEDAE